MSQPKFLALLAFIAALSLPMTADARGSGSGSGMSGHGGGNATWITGHSGDVSGRDARYGRGGDAVQRDSVGRPTDARIRTAALERDEHDAPVVRNQIVAVEPTGQQLEAARRLNFAVGRTDDLSALGISAVILHVPTGVTTIQALAALRIAIPDGKFDYVHVYSPSGGRRSDMIPAAPGVAIQSEDVAVGMVDGGVAQSHPALRHANVTVRGFAGGGRPLPTNHGTAVASLFVGQAADFSGYIPGAELFVADVFCGSPDGGDAAAIARALNWLAEKRIPVVNISLTGPSNRFLEVAVKAFLAKGHVLVAAAGNDGPAAPANYPASYPGVIAVTSVDTAHHIAFDANRVDFGFAAQGTDIRAAVLSGGYDRHSGTSYASPAVAAEFALLLLRPDVNAAKTAFTTLASQSSRVGGFARLYLIEGRRPPPAIAE